MVGIIIVSTNAPFYTCRKIVQYGCLPSGNGLTALARIGEHIVRIILFLVKIILLNPVHTSYTCHLFRAEASAPAAVFRLRRHIQPVVNKIHKGRAVALCGPHPVRISSAERAILLHIVVYPTV